MHATYNDSFPPIFEFLAAVRPSVGTRTREKLNASASTPRPRSPPSATRQGYTSFAKFRKLYGDYVCPSVELGVLSIFRCPMPRNITVREITNAAPSRGAPATHASVVAAKFVGYTDAGDSNIRQLFRTDANVARSPCPLPAHVFFSFSHGTDHITLCIIMRAP